MLVQEVRINFYIILLTTQKTSTPNFNINNINGNFLFTFILIDVGEIVLKRNFLIAIDVVSLVNMCIQVINIKIQKDMFYMPFRLQLQFSSEENLANKMNTISGYLTKMDQICVLSIRVK